MSGVRYVSTRGRAPELGFSDALLAGLAADGGLYVPADWPLLPPAAELDAATGYADAAHRIITPFVGDDIAPDVLAAMCADAYATFRHAAVVPLVQLDDRQWLAELYHGPTLAFKDVALQLVGRLFDHVLGRRGERVTIVGATSGDTGSAAIEAVRDCAHVDIVILYPDGGPSEVQRRQMTTVDAPNVHTVAVDGTFDDCQDLVKAMFGDEPFRADLRLSAVNSINWARVMAQVVYYVTTARSLAGPVSVCVPTGNFGNLFAGWVARRMGTPIEDFIVASNDNDILTRFVNDNDMSTATVVPTLSPSMDIQVSSNFERMLWVMNDGNGARTGEQMLRFRETGTLAIDDETRERWITGAFRAAKATDAEVARRDPQGPRRHRVARRPPHRLRHPGRPSARRRPPRDHDGDGPPGQVPRRRRAGDGHPPAAAGPPRRPLRPARADRALRRRPGHGRGPRAGARPPADRSRASVAAGVCGPAIPVDSLHPA